MERWPNFFIVGAPKAGTTSLYEYLNKIPEIYMSENKEPNYFSLKTIPNKKPFKPIRNTTEYLALFMQANKQKVVGEASTNYLYDPDAAHLIHKKIPDALILISLRNPIERAWSHYLMVKNSGWMKNTFHEQITKELKNKIDFDKPHLRLKAGLYSDDVQKYLDVFGKNQVKIIIFEEWINDTKITVNDIIKFLGLDYSVKENFQESYKQYVAPRGVMAQKIVTSKSINKISRLFSSSTRGFMKKSLVKKDVKPKMNEEGREKLIKFYQDDVMKLEKMLDRKLPWSGFHC